MTQSTEPDGPNTLGRRGFLVGLSALLTLVAAGVGYLRWATPKRPRGEAEPEHHTSAHAAPHADADADSQTQAGTEGFFAAADHDVLFELADIIVPRDGTAPAASEVGLLPRLEEWIQANAGRRFTYAALWPELARAARSTTAGATRPAQEALEAACQGWYAEFRSAGSSASSAARAFEQLRRDVLRTYYSTEAGHRVLGYTGPAMRMAPSSPSPSPSPSPNPSASA